MSDLEGDHDHELRDLAALFRRDIENARDRLMAEGLPKEIAEELLNEILNAQAFANWSGPRAHRHLR